MTALNDFERLESTGIWQASPDAQRRDVIISVGEATLTLADQQNSALTHWSLPAIRRVNPGERPAMFRPGKDSAERLELSDETMIDAISTVQNAIEKRKPHPGRLRFGIAGGTIAVLTALAVFWLPGAMLNYTASVVPAPKRTAIGQNLLENIQRVSGKPCNTILGQQSLRLLHQRLFPGQEGKIVVVSSGVRQTVLLPGQIIVLNRALVEDFEAPDVVAGFLLAQDLIGKTLDPLDQLLQNAGLGASFKLLTTGNIPDAALARYAETLLTNQHETPADVPLLERFNAASVRASPYAYAVDISGESTIKLIEADPVTTQTSQEILDDGAWVSLQGICET